MANVTFSIDEELLRQSKIAAIQADSSLNAIVRALLSGFVQSVGSPQNATGNYLKLLAFSLGRMPYRKLMMEMNIESDEELFLIMCRAGLPMPTLANDVPRETLQVMDKFLIK